MASRNVVLYASEFEAEVLIPLLFNASRFAVADALTADYTLLAGFTKIQGQQGRGLRRGYVGTGPVSEGVSTFRLPWGKKCSTW